MSDDWIFKTRNDWSQLGCSSAFQFPTKGTSSSSCESINIDSIEFFFFFLQCMNCPYNVALFFNDLLMHVVFSGQSCMAVLLTFSMGCPSYKKSCLICPFPSVWRCFGLLCWALWLSQCLCYVFYHFNNRAVIICSAETATETLK